MINTKCRTSIFCFLRFLISPGGHKWPRHSCLGKMAGWLASFIRGELVWAEKKVSGIHPSVQPSLHMSVPCLHPLNSIMFNSSVMFGYTHYSDVWGGKGSHWGFCKMHMSCAIDIHLPLRRSRHKVCTCQLCVPSGQSLGLSCWNLASQSQSQAHYSLKSQLVVFWTYWK